jgi:hypothetical protein
MRMGALHVGTLVLSSTLLLAGCSLYEGSSPNIAPDAIDPGPRENLATVEVSVFTNIASSPPIIGAPVAFVDPSGWGFVVHTGPDGIARGEVVEGGSVTALVGLVPLDNPPYLSSMFGVHDGDKIRLGMWSAPFEPPTGTPACTEVDFTATLTNVDAHALTSLSLSRAVPGAYGNGFAEEQTIAPTTVRTVSGAGGASAVITMSVSGPGHAQQGVISEWIDGCQTDYSLDMAEMLPWVGYATADGMRIDIPRSGGSITGDMLTTAISYETDDTYVNWNVITPPVDSFKLPSLPGELSHLNPTEPIGRISVQLDDYELFDGYDDARKVLGAQNGIGHSDAPTGLGRLRRTYTIQ